MGPILYGTDTLGDRSYMGQILYGADTIWDQNNTKIEQNDTIPKNKRNDTGIDTINGVSVHFAQV